MGLDSVEFALEVERKFSIRLRDEDFQLRHSIGDIVKTVTAEIRLTQPGSPLTEEQIKSEVIAFAAHAWGRRRKDIDERTTIDELVTESESADSRGCFLRPKSRRGNSS